MSLVLSYQKNGSKGQCIDPRVFEGNLCLITPVQCSSSVVSRPRSTTRVQFSKETEGCQPDNKVAHFAAIWHYCCYIYWIVSAVEYKTKAFIARSWLPSIQISTAGLPKCVDSKAVFQLQLIAYWEERFYILNTIKLNFYILKYNLKSVDAFSLIARF